MPPANWITENKCDVATWLAGIFGPIHAYDLSN